MTDQRMQENQRLRELLNMDVREEVKWFAGEMEATLKKNDTKGHWSGCSLDYLMNRLHEEVSELWRELWFYDRNPSRYNARCIVKECTDVANFAMMIADNIQRSLKE